MKKATIFSFLISTFLLLTFSTAHAQLFEDFESGDKASYATAPLDLDSGTWLFDDALIGNLAGDRKNGTRSARIRDGEILMQFDKADGADEVSFFAANFSNDTGGRLQVSYSINGGSSWEDLGDEINLTSTLTEYTLQASVEGNFRIRFTKTGGNRINIDDVRITDYVDSPEEPTLSFRIDGDSYNNNDIFDFGTNNGTASAQLQLRNNGQQDLEITSFEIDNSEFSVDGDPTGTIESLVTNTYTLNFSSENIGQRNAVVTLETNDPDNPTFSVNLTTEVFDGSTPISIAEARSLPQGTTVTVAGWVTVTDQFRGPVYFQDETGGIAWFNGQLMREGTFDLDVALGDSVVVTGELGNFNNLLQIIDEESYSIYPEANRDIEPLDITFSQLNTGNYESQLIRVQDVAFQSTGTFSGGTNYTTTDASGEGQVRVDNFTNIGGTTIPTVPVNVTGVAGRFMNTRQLLPRFTNDIVDVSGGPIITSSAPYESYATSSSITFEWTTELEGNSEVCFGFTVQLELGCLDSHDATTEHSITLDGLEPATVYKAQVRSAIEDNVSSSSIQIVSTGSPEGTTGEIIAYFNRSVDHNLSTFTQANQNENFDEKLIEMINNAEDSAVFAFYSISGGVGNAIANAIINANNRGVDVRVIATGHTGSQNEAINFMAQNGVDAVQSLGNEQQHNKFAIFDAHHDDPTKAWVVTSSWNATDSGTFNQFQNMINIQDVALARAYVREFNQMWGAESGSFNASQAKFSQDKEVVNPSTFWIGEDDTEVRLFFSPQGNAEAEIARTLLTAEYSINLGLNLITRRPLSNTMLSRFNDGVKVRGVIGDIGGDASEWDYLSGWADVHHFEQSSFGLLHHKYAIVDGENPELNPVVITGSHNWSNNANNWNDENTLFIYNARIANEFIQEFGARYTQAGGQDAINVTSTDREITELPDRFEVHQNYPNPFNPTTNLQFTLAQSDEVSIRVYDVMGREVARLLNSDSYSSGTHTVTFDASNLSSGVYFYRVALGSGQMQTGKMMLVK